MNVDYHKRYVLEINSRLGKYIGVERYSYTDDLEKAKMYRTIGGAKAAANYFAQYLGNVQVIEVGIFPKGVVYESGK